MIKKTALYFIGIIFFLIGIYLTVFEKEPHFYTFFSIGLFIIFLLIYNNLAKVPFFYKWDKNKFMLFWIVMLGLSIIIDRIGMALGYWVSRYVTVTSEIIKYVFEWAVALIYIQLFFMIGVLLFRKLKFGYYTSIILSLLIFSTAIGFVTEYFNLFSDSWIVLSMPFTNYKIGDYFVVFQTLGYWVMAIIPFITYILVDNIKKLTDPKYFEPKKQK